MTRTTFNAPSGDLAAALVLTATLIAGCATPPADPVVASAGPAGATHVAPPRFGPPWGYADDPGALRHYGP